MSTTQTEQTPARRTYRERREAKAERLAEWAEKREAKGAAQVEQSRRMGDVIPFGQPILVGHYSEGRDRRYRDRIVATMDRGCENLSKAEEMRRRAASITAAAERAIYSDDPDAIERLRERIAELEAERAQMKAANAAYRKAHREQLKALSAYQRDRALPFPSFKLTNLGGNISRNRKRLAQMERPV